MTRKRAVAFDLIFFLLKVISIDPGKIFLVLNVKIVNLFGLCYIANSKLFLESEVVVLYEITAMSSAKCKTTVFLGILSVIFETKYI